MQRVIPVPQDVPDGYEPIVIVFSEVDSKGNTGMCCHASDLILAALSSKSIADRMRVIKKICSAVEEMLLQYSQNPDEITHREI